MKKKRSERKPVDSGSARLTRNKTRQQQDEEPGVSRIEPLHLSKESPLSRSCLELRRDPDVQSREMDPSLEETLLAFLDTHGVRDVEDIDEDKLTFLDATYARCGVRADASVPTQKLFEAIYLNVQESRSVELTLASFQLLKDLEQRHPRVAIAPEKADDSPGQTTLRLDVDRRVWSPLEHVIEEMESTGMMLPAEGPIPLSLLTLVEILVMDTEDGNQRKPMNFVSRVASNAHDGVKIVGQFLMLQHLITLIEKDLCCCLHVYEATMNTRPVQKSCLYRLLCALPTDIRKTFLSNLLFLLNPRDQEMKMDEEVPNGKEVDHCLTNGSDADGSNKFALLPSANDFSHLAYRLFLMVMEIDHITRKCTLTNSRSLRRGSFPDDLLSIFSDARDLEAYLQALDSPWTKMRFIVDYFVINAPLDIIVKGLKGSTDRDTFEKLLACFGDGKTVKFVHKFGEDVLPLVLAHAFQAYLIIHVQATSQDHENEQVSQAKLLEVGRLLVATLNELRELEGQTEMLPVAEHAIQMAESILLSS